MGLFNKEARQAKKEAKEQEKRQAEINKNTDKAFNNTPFLGTNEKKVNDMKMKLRRQQEKVRDQLEEEFTNLRSEAQRSFPAATTAQNIRQLVDLTRRIEMGLNVATTQTLTTFLMEQVADARRKCHNNNPAAVDQIVFNLRDMLVEMENEDAKRLYSDPDYVQLRIAEFKLRSQLEDLESKHRSLQEQARTLVENSKTGDHYLNNDALAEKLKKIKQDANRLEESKAKLQNKLDPTQLALNQKRDAILSQPLGNDNELFALLNRTLVEKEQLEANSEEFAEFSKQLGVNNTAVSNSAMEFNDVRNDKQEVSDEDIDALLNSI